MAHNFTSDSYTTSLELTSKLRDDDERVSDPEQCTGIYAWYRDEKTGQQKQVSAGDHSQPRRLARCTPARLVHNARWIGNGGGYRGKLTKQQPSLKVAKTSTRVAMHVFKKKAFVQACSQYPVKAESIMAVYKVLDKSTAQNPQELMGTLSTLDNFTHRSGWWVIDIGGNELRLVAEISFQKQRIYVKHIFNHTEYDRANKWYRSPKNKGVMP